MKITIATLSAAVIFLILDMTWLGYVAHGFYRSQLGQLMAPAINIPVAVAFYAIYVVGVAVFVLQPALAADSWKHALYYGAFFGFVAYATYDFTNLATLRDWPVAVTVADLAWGTFATAVSSALAVAIAQRFG